MYCSNCGKWVKDGAKFCGNCGTPVIQPESAARGSAGTQGAGANGAGGAGRGSAGPRRPSARSAGSQKPPAGPGKLPSWFPVVCAAVIVVIGVALGATVGVRTFRRTFASPARYYLYAETKGLKDLTGSLSDIYDNTESRTETMEKGYHLDASVNLGEAGQSLIGAIADTSMSWLEDVSVSLDYTHDGDVSMETSAALNGTTLLSADILTDLASGEMYIKFPELSDAYLSADLDYADIYYDIDLESVLSTDALRLTDYFSSGAEMADFVLRYGQIILDHIDDVTKEKDTLSVDAVSQKCTLLTAVLTESEMEDLCLDLIGELRSDDQVRQIIMAFADDCDLIYSDYYYDGEDLYDEFLDALDEAEDYLDYLTYSIDSDAELIMRIWVDSSDEIVGRSVTVVEDGDSIDILEYYRPESGKNFALDCRAGDDTDWVRLYGSGTTSGSGNSASYTLSMSDVGSLLYIDTEDVDTDSAKEGYINGSYTLTPSSALTSAFSSRVYYRYGTMLSGSCSLRLTFENSKNSSAIDAELLVSDEDFAGAALEMTAGGKVSASLPTSQDTVYDVEDDIERYIYTVDWDNVEEILDGTDIPSEYKRLIREVISEIR